MPFASKLFIGHGGETFCEIILAIGAQETTAVADDSFKAISNLQVAFTIHALAWLRLRWLRLR